MGRHKQVKSNLTPFDWFKHATEFKTPWNDFTQEQQKSFNSFILNKVISMNQYNIDLVNEVQTFQVPDQFVYEFYLKVLPQRKMFNRYIKSKKQKPKEELLNHLSEYFQCSKREVIEFFDLLKIDQILNILRMRGLPEKEIVKVTANG